MQPPKDNAAHPSCGWCCVNMSCWFVTAWGACAAPVSTACLCGVRGQASGGHNVIAGVFDYAKLLHDDSVVVGFLNGPHGIFSNNHCIIDAALLSGYRNMGGFDIIGSGRHKIESPEQFAASLKNCTDLDLDGLLVIGGDDSNTNACLLAEYFAKCGAKTVVNGAPKTIDGDLKIPGLIPVSFGFDTATKTYAEQVGNIELDALSTQKVLWKPSPDRLGALDAVVRAAALPEAQWSVGLAPLTPPPLVPTHVQRRCRCDLAVLPHHPSHGALRFTHCVGSGPADTVRIGAPHCCLAVRATCSPSVGVSASTAMLTIRVCSGYFSGVLLATVAGAARTWSSSARRLRTRACRWQPSPRILWTSSSSVLAPDVTTASSLCQRAPSSLSRK